MINVAYVDHDNPLLNNPSGPLSAGDRVRGLPQWTIAARYTIHAETDDPVANGPTSGLGDSATSLLFGPMLQMLLQDRLQLKLHRVTEQSPMYFQVYEAGASVAQPVAAYVTFFRGSTKALETPLLKVTQGLDPKSHMLPVKLSFPLIKLKPGEYNCQVTVLDPTAQKASFWQAPVMVIP